MNPFTLNFKELDSSMCEILP